MIRVLIVEDDLSKFGALKAAVLDAGVDEGHVEHAYNTADAIGLCRRYQFDLLLLDVNIPKKFDGDSVRGEGISLLHRLQRDVSSNKPKHIVGVTAYADVVAEFGSEFADRLWTLVHYSEGGDRWIGQVKAKVDYVAALKKSENFTDGATYGVDVAVICALPDVEWRAIKALSCGWQPLRVPHDQTRYISGSIETADRSISIISAAAPRMGMPSSAVLASKIIATFRPRIIAMTGICAGRVGKSELGDVIIADPAFDWGSGKIDTHNGEPRFRPSPHQLDLDVDVAESLRELFGDAGLRAKIRERCPSAPGRGDLQVHIAPMASGASVVANSSTFEGLLDKNRDVMALEMEAYSVFSAATGCSKPRPMPLVMKAVCDFADENKKDDAQAFAASASAACFYEAIKCIFSLGHVGLA
jgi:nucleoside phosphorylase/CheY-like chemotaxis protein